MPCDIVQIPGGGGRIIHVLKRHGRTTCSFCVTASTKLCDFPHPDGGTCDKPLCESHAVSAGKNKDWCFDHKAEARNE
jgi:hypothetical protein